MPTDHPTLDELRAVTQPESTMSRRNAEHWLARLFLRKVSLRVTRLLIRTPVSANALTGWMIVVGLAAAVVIGTVGGWLGAVLGFLLIQAYFLLDLCDGEVARWRRTTSITGVYLDRVGHYLVEAAVLSAIGFRAGAFELGGWSTLGVATGLCAVLIKAESDLVDVARVPVGGRAAQRGVGRAAPHRPRGGPARRPGAQDPPGHRGAGGLLPAAGRRRGGRGRR